MNKKNMILAVLAAFAVMFALSGLWHIVLLGDFYSSNDVALARTEPNMLFVVLGVFILTFIMAIIYPSVYKCGSLLKEGFRFGAVIGIIWALPMQLVFHGIWNLPLSGVLVDSAWHVVEQGVGGIVIAYVYGTGKKNN